MYRRQTPNHTDLADIIHDSVKNAPDAVSFDALEFLDGGLADEMLGPARRRVFAGQKTVLLAPPATEDGLLKRPD